MSRRNESVNGRLEQKLGRKRTAFYLTLRFD